MIKSNNPFSSLISIVIPCKNDAVFLENVLIDISKQSYKNFEIIIIDSSFYKDELEALIKKKFSSMSIKIISTDSAYPGEARNIGVSASKGVYIAFIDAKSRVDSQWLEYNSNLLLSSEADIVLGRFKCSDKDLSFTQKILKASTHGNLEYISTPGSILSKEKFLHSGGFKLVGAGEDIDWVNRIRDLQWSIETSDNISFFYVGYSKRIFSHFKKCIFYSFENSKLNILQTQKNLYLYLLLLMGLYFSYSWNYLFTKGMWDASPYFIPNLNTAIWISIGLIYIFARGVFLPLKKKEKLIFIFPINWILIALISFIIDILKIPGRALGAFKLIFNSDQDF